MTVHAPTPEAGRRNTHGAGCLLHFSSRHQGDGRAVVEPSTVEAQQPLQHADAIITAVTVKICVEARADRNPYLPCGCGRRNAQRALSGNVDGIGAVSGQELFQMAGSGEAKAQVGVPG